MILFKDKEFQRLFERDGFVVTDLLSENEVADLRQLYFDTKADHLSVTDKMHSTCDTGNIELVLMVDERLKAVILPKIGEVLESYEALLASFLVKEIGVGSETEFHQDPTFIDSFSYASANVWVPMQDTDHRNGNLRVIKGSHRMVETMVVTPGCPTPYSSFRHLLDEFAIDIPLRAGQAVIVNHRTIHGATANMSDTERIAAVTAIKSIDAKWRLYFLEPGKAFDYIESYEINTEVFAKLVKNQRPKDAEFLGHISFDFPSMTEREFVTFMYHNGWDKGLS